jgi:hypothetical protein
MATNCEHCKNMIDKNPHVLSDKTPENNFVTTRSCRFNHKQERLGFITIYHGDCPDFTPKEPPKRPPSRLFTLQLILLQSIYHHLTPELQLHECRGCNRFTQIVTKTPQPAGQTTPSPPSER